MSDVKKKKFLFLDDDSFHPEHIRHPRYYYPLIGADEILKIFDECEIQKNTTVEGAIDYIEAHGCPNFISFDNDLQRELEGFHLAKWLIDKDLDNPGFIPEDFQFFVHSQNIIAKDTIYSLLGQYLSVREQSLASKPNKLKM
jgi:hypothetical protein